MSETFFEEKSMSPQEVTQLGMGGLLIWLFLRELFAFLKTKNGKENIKYLEHIEMSVEKISENIARQTEILSEMSRGFSSVRESQIRIETKLNGKTYQPSSPN